MIKQSDPHCEFCEGPATWIAVPQECQPQYGCRLSCDRHRHWVRRLITMDVGSGVYVREYPGCDLCEGPVTADRLPPAYAVPVCHRCLPPPEPLPVADQYDERHSPGGESQVERLSDVDRQLCAIRARLECARQGYAVHVGCGGECTEDSPGGYAYTCQACGATVDWRSPDIAVPPAHDHYERDVSWLLSRLAEQEDCYRCPSPKIERHEDVPICRRCGRCHVQSHWQTERLRLVHDGGSAVSLEYFDEDNDEWRMADDMDAEELRALGSAALAMASILGATEATCDG